MGCTNTEYQYLNNILLRAYDHQQINYNSAVFNFVVDTDGSANEIAGIRWYEIRQDSDSDPWYIFQEGTYTSPNGKHAWLGSMGIDMNGNIGMGYSGMGGTTNTYVSSYYTGRFQNDPLGVMTIEETLLDAGGSNITQTNRSRDYAKLALDPSNQKSFWFITENKQGNNISNPVGLALAGALRKSNEILVSLASAPVLFVILKSNNCWFPELPNFTSCPSKKALPGKPKSEVVVPKASLALLELPAPKFN